MKSFMGLSLFVIGLVSIILGLVIIARDRFAAKKVKLMTAAEEKPAGVTADLINAIANFVEKLFGQFAKKEKLPTFLIVIGFTICVAGWWLVK